jgi:hypothetical protein
MNKMQQLTLGFAQVYLTEVQSSTCIAKLQFPRTEFCSVAAANKSTFNYKFSKVWA